MIETVIAETMGVVEWLGSIGMGTWIGIGVVAVVLWSWIAYEIYTSPVYPSDYRNVPTEAPDKYKK